MLKNTLQWALLITMVRGPPPPTHTQPKEKKYRLVEVALGKGIRYMALIIISSVDIFGRLVPVQSSDQFTQMEYGPKKWILRKNENRKRRSKSYEHTFCVVASPVQGHDN